MKFKFLLIFIGLFAIQFLYSCDLFYCNSPCPNFRDYHIKFIDLKLDISHYNYDWDYSQEIPDSVSRSNDEFEVILNFTPDFVSDPKTISFREIGGGFSTASACSDCYYESFYYLIDLIESVDVEILNLSTDSVIDANSLFSYDKSYNGPISLDEIDFDAIDYFNEAPVLMHLSLEETASIPDSSIFKITVTMESGTTFSSETELIRFH